MITPKYASTDTDISRCFAVTAELRPHLKEDRFVSLIRGMQADGYKMVYIEDAGAVVSMAGFRIQTTLFMAKNLYVDDLVTSSESRSKGYGRRMIDWLRDLALREGCTHLHLDSGTQRHRAHRFYLRQGMDIASFHFSEKLDNIGS